MYEQPGEQQEPRLRVVFRDHADQEPTRNHRKHVDTRQTASAGNNLVVRHEGDAHRRTESTERRNVSPFTIANSRGVAKDSKGSHFISAKNILRAELHDLFTNQS